MTGGHSHIHFLDIGCSRAACAFMCVCGARVFGVCAGMSDKGASALDGHSGRWGQSGYAKRKLLPVRQVYTRLWCMLSVLVREAP